ncbi:hypothetical protein Y032_0134g1835 [Ancylostoma ceylanicum]|uniref:Serine aminopeptidase S33 domain-containing protein n=1 Tax=Ancylostoma ceylanicum TaxID=53326 RepID=A0A016T633_9BILA|nr:hypothetical protein Y032_0134g1835 [Ancylostoma ceylanicum]
MATPQALFPRKASTPIYEQFTIMCVKQRQIKRYIRVIERNLSFIKKIVRDLQIVLLGYSIGTTAVIDLASTHPDSLAGVILVAPFTSGLRLLGNQPKREKTHFFDRFVS